MTDDNQNNWWKWGDPQHLIHLDEYAKLKTYLEEKWGGELKEEFSPPASFRIRSLEKEKQDRIKGLFSEIPSARLRFDESSRLLNALGKSYYDVIRIFEDDQLIVPDAVLYPLSHEEVQYVIDICQKEGIRLSAVGGGTNVVGALTIEDQKDAPWVFLDMKKMDRDLEIDEDHLTATFQAGILGPKMEEILNARGFTLGHFPQSFEFSTLGGWVVTRSAGQASTYYGKIEDLVEAVKVATPAGTLVTPSFTRDAEGVNILPLFVGSEGTLGIVTEVKVKISRLSSGHRWIAALFHSFEDGTQFMKEVIQHGLKPSVIRLSDEEETYFFTKLAGGSDTGLKARITSQLKKAILQWKNFDKPNLLIMRLEETAGGVTSQVIFVKDLIKKYQGWVLDSSLGEKWEEGRYTLPYLRDSLVEHGIFIDTMETAVPWNKVPVLHRAMQKKLKGCPEFFKEKGVVLTHISHIYPAAACMYFILLCPQDTRNRLDQWKKIKELVTDTIVSNGGSISHHHGIGADHRKWYLDKSDPLSMKVLREVKSLLDPKHILNPGKLFDEQR